MLTFQVSTPVLRAGLIDLDVTWLVQIGLFLLVYAVLAFGFFRPYAALLRRRDAATKGRKEHAAALLAEAQALEQKVEGRLADARAQAMQIRRDLVEEGRAQRDRIVAEALQVPVPVLQAYLKGMIRDPFGSRRTDLKLPVAQFAAGPAESDAVKARARLTQAGLDALPRLRVVPFPKSRHWPMWDEPERFLAELRAFEAGLAIR